MPSVAELTIAAELKPLEEIAANRGWPLKRLGTDQFTLQLPAKDGTTFTLFVKCNGFPVTPPAWHWYDEATGDCDRAQDTPKGSGFFHSAGVICAPWNRLAYNTVDPRGPHGDWTIGDWRRNPNTGACTTLAAMALRLFVELNGAKFHGRMG